MNIIDLAKQAEEYANNVVQSNDNDYSWGFLRDQKFAALVEAAARADEREAIAQMFESAPALVQFAQNDKGGCLVCGFTPKLASEAIRERGAT